MVDFQKFTLENGLRVIVHEDPASSLAAMNLLYDVGARDEDPDRTGFAHLFEHLMFEGSKNIPSFDQPLQLAGGESNAFTSNDITNYYLTLPAHNLETGFWLESDRMLQLSFSEEALKVQQNVVIEEYKQRYENQPYGDIWLQLRPLAYTTHPYRWPTIGRDMEHVETASLESVVQFFDKYYHPGNAVLAVAGNVKFDQVRALTEKWFAPIPAGQRPVRNLPQEPEQLTARELTVYRPVPADAIYIAFHMEKRTGTTYHTTDLLSDLLSMGKSSRFYQHLVKKQQLFSDIGAFLMGSYDNGLFVIGGRLTPNTSPDAAIDAVWEEVENVKANLVSDQELEKVKNKVEAALAFSEMDVLNRATNLCICELLGDAENINKESSKYAQVTRDGVREQANRILRKENSSVLRYLKQPSA